MWWTEHSSGLGVALTLDAKILHQENSKYQTIEILEHMAAIDASVAWNVMLGSEINAMAAGGMVCRHRRLLGAAANSSITSSPGKAAASSPGKAAMESGSSELEANCLASSATSLSASGSVHSSGNNAAEGISNVVA